MSSASKSSKQFIIWLEDLDTYVQEGSNQPSLFASEREAKKCAKELWPNSPWRIETKSHIKVAERRWEEQEKKRIKERTTKVTAGGFCFHFIPPVSTRKFCVFLFENRIERVEAKHSAKTLEAAKAWAEKAAKKFISLDHPDRSIQILNCTDPQLPTWETLEEISLPPDTKSKLKSKKKVTKVIKNNVSPEGKPQPVPHMSPAGKWVCPISGKQYEAGKSVPKRIFTNILKAVSEAPDDYLAVDKWKAFSYGDGWVCPYTGKVFSRTGKRLDDHISKQRKQIKENIL